MSEADLKRLRVDINKLVGFTPELEAQFIKLQKLTEKVINSPQFRNRCLTFGYEYTEGRFWYKRRVSVKGFKSTGGDSPSDIYLKFMSGKDKFNTKADSDIDLYTTLYFSNRGVIGYTYGSTYKTWINTKFFYHRMSTAEGRCQVIANIIHEYMHNLGYQHAVRWNSTRQYTVPYAYGDIAGDVAKLYI